MPSFHLISHHLCPYVQRARIVLTEKGIPFEQTYIDLANKPDWFVTLSPLGRVPVLIAGEAVLFESQVIAEYVDEVTPGSLHPEDPLEKAMHRSWIEFGSETLNAIGRFYNAEDSDSFERARADLRARLERISSQIAGPNFLGDRFHMIDGVWGTIFRYFDVFDQITDFGFQTDLEPLSAWRTQVRQRPSVITATPDGYAERLQTFLINRNACLSTLVKQAA